VLSRDPAGASPASPPLGDDAADGPRRGLAERLLGVPEVFDAELRDSAVLRALLDEHLDRLLPTAGRPR
jgi:hypothetical protein